MCRTAVFDIAGIRYGLEKGAGKTELEVPSAHRRFLSDRAPALHFRVEEEPWPVVDELRPLFDAHSWWTMLEAPDKRVISFFDTVSPYPENRRAVFSPDYRSGTIYCPHAAQQRVPLSYPLEELIYINVLPSYQGVIVHSCGVQTDEGGYVFVGVSGAGKSTLSKIVMRETDWKVLSDDRIILRNMKDGIQMFGTPWHGEVDVCENRGVPLRRIFFLNKKTQENALVRWSPVQAATRLIARCFPPFWDADGMARVTQLCIEVASRTPCYELRFLPEASVVECLAGLKNA